MSNRRQFVLPFHARSSMTSGNAKRSDYLSRLACLTTAAAILVAATALSHTVVGNELAGGDGSTLSYRGHGEVARFEPGAKLFTDRQYTLLPVPEELHGLNFLRESIDFTHIRITEGGSLLALTPHSNERRSSQVETLKAAGFQPLDVESFQLFGSADWDRVLTFRKDVSPGETYRFGKCVLVLGFNQAHQQEVQPWNRNAGEQLHNGIRLPEVWPPDHRCPQSAEPMPVPYLDHPPEVLPIDVGRQLFVDDFLIEETDLRRTYHSAERYPGNPVYEPESRDELDRRAAVYLGQGGVFFDPEDRLFKMFYVAGWRGPLAMATSSDLVNWTRPELSDRGNVLIDRSVDDSAVWLDLRAVRADERVKYMECHRGRHPHAGHQFLYTSADGRQWSDGVSAGRHRGDYSSLFYHPFRNVWVFSMRATDGMGRATYYCESREFFKADWDRDAVYWQGADRLDEPEPEGSYHPAAHAHGVQLYSRPAVAYESLIVGMHQIHRGPTNEICEREKFPKLTDLEVGFSRDGFHWHRPSRTPFLAGTRREGDWDRAYLHSTTGVFVVLGEKLVFPYTGFSGIAPDGSRGMYHGASIGLAFLRRDGFASMDAGPDGGTLTTRPVTFHGTRMFVNASVPDGRLRVEILDETGQPIEPFTLANSVPLTGDSTLAPIVWQGGSDLAALRGKPVRFRFELAGGSLYAFWVSLDESGRSDGFVAAGGPGYSGPTDTVGRAALANLKKARDR
jgi:hypothetical protein